MAGGSRSSSCTAASATARRGTPDAGLRSHFRTIALSCRGAWPNRKLEPDEEITLDTFVKDLASFIKELDLAPVHLVGHSSPGGFGA